MNLVLGLLILGGSSVAIWGGITDPEGGVVAGLRDAFAGKPTTKRWGSATSAAFVSDLVNITGMSSAATGTGGSSSGGGSGLGSAAGGGNPAGATITHPRTFTAGGITYFANADGSFSADAIKAGAPANTGAGTGKRAAVVHDVESWLGTPYAWGGNTRSGVDCSGLVQQVFRANGIKLPRISAMQAGKGRRVSSPRPGDLVAFGAPVHHIGIVIGGGQMIHAPHPGTKVRRESIAGASKSMRPVIYRDVIG